MAWEQVLFLLFVFSVGLVMFISPSTLIADAFDTTLHGQPQRVIYSAMIMEALICPLLIVALVNLLTPKQTKSQICDSDPRKFLGNYFAAASVASPAFYSAAYPVIYVAIAICTALYSSNILNWFLQSVILFIVRNDLIRHNGVSKLDFIYTWAMILFPVKGCWVSLVSGYHLFTEKWNVSNYYKVLAVLEVLRLALGILLTIFCVKQSRRIVPNMVAIAGNEKGTTNDLLLDNIGILVRFTVALFPLFLG